MAKSKTPAKRARTAEKNRARNMSKKSAMKTAVKKFDAAVAGKKPAEAEAMLVVASSMIDRNAAKGILHRNKAARQKSRLAKKFNSLVQ